MDTLKFTEGFLKSIETSPEMAVFLKSSCVVILVEGELDWERLKKAAPETEIIVTSSKAELIQDAKTAGFKAFQLLVPDDEDISDRLSKALMGGFTKGYFKPGTPLAVFYSRFDPTIIDSLSVINLGEHYEAVKNWRFLRKIETDVPIKTLKTVVNVALEIGREGREGQNVGTMFVVGDTKRVMECSRPVGFDPVRGYTCKERSLFDPVVREGIKEVAPLDGAFVVSHEGIVRAACRLLNAPTAKLTVAKGLGSRHWAAAAITKVTNSLAVVVSQSDGAVRIFQNGDILYTIASRANQPIIYRETEKEDPFLDESSDD